MLIVVCLMYKIYIMYLIIYKYKENIGIKMFLCCWVFGYWFKKVGYLKGRFKKLIIKYNCKLVNYLNNKKIS